MILINRASALPNAKIAMGTVLKEEKEVPGRPQPKLPSLPFRFSPLIQCQIMPLL